MQKYWFRAKQYGWGWYPASWQGWSVLALYLVAALALFRGTDLDSHSGSDTLINFFPRLIILTGLLIWICAKTGERPTWRWAGKAVSPWFVLGWMPTFLIAFSVAMMAIKFILLQR